MKSDVEIIAYRDAIKKTRERSRVNPYASDENKLNDGALEALTWVLDEMSMKELLEVKK